jgi:hypothetical protein
MTNGIIALILTLITAGLILLFGLVPSLQSMASLRAIPAYERLRKAVGLAVEKGTRIHVSLGKSSLTQTTNPSALVGLTTLEKVSLASSSSDRPPIASSGEGSLAILSQDTERASFRISGALELYNPDRGFLTGPTPFSYVAGILPLVDSENISAHILVGNFGPEAALVTESAEMETAFTFAASDSLPAQAVFFASAQEALIGEELFAIPAYLESGPLHRASVHVQDILRWIVIVTMIAGAALKFLGVI